MAVFKMGFLLVAYLLSRLQGWSGLGGFGLSLTGSWAPALSAGLLTGLLVFTLSLLAALALRFETLQELRPAAVFLQNLPMTLVMTFFPSLAEDLLTRGYLFGHLRSLKPMAWILVSALVYVLNHIWRLNEGLPVLSYLFLLGVVLACCVIVKKSLWLAFGIHWGANIAYELSRLGVTTQTEADPSWSVWTLAAAWALLLLILGLRYRRVFRAVQHKPVGSST